MKRWMIALLTLVLTAAVLLGVRFGLAGYAESNAQRALEATCRQLLPGSSTFTEEPYSGEDTNIRTVYKGETGYVVETVTAGYVGDIVLLTGVDNNGRVTGIFVRQMQETYGLGRNAVSAAFLGQFLNTAGDAEVGTTIDAVSGATVTSKAITKGVNSACAFVTGADVATAATEWGG
ncbi:MAG: FMN-binding protein [Candidatus Aphodomorpha sp.]